MWNNILYSNYKSSYGSNYLQSRTENYTNPNSPIAKSDMGAKKDTFTKALVTAGGVAVAGIALFKGRTAIANLFKKGMDFFLKYIPKK